MKNYRKAMKSDIKQISELALKNLESNIVNYEEGFVYGEYIESELEDTRVIVDAEQNILAVGVVRDLDEQDCREYSIPKTTVGKYIHGVCVRKESRRLGMGKLLYENIIEEFKDKYLYSCIQHDPHYNLASVKFHESLGFIVIGEGLFDGVLYKLYELK